MPSRYKPWQNSARRLETPSPVCCQYCFATGRASGENNTAEMAGQRSSSVLADGLVASRVRCITDRLEETSGGARARTNVAERTATSRVGKRKALDPAGPYFSASSLAKAWILWWM